MFKVLAFIFLSLFRFFSTHNRVGVIGLNYFNRNRIAEFQLIMRQPV